MRRDFSDRRVTLKGWKEKRGKQVEDERRGHEVKMGRKEGKGYGRVRGGKRKVQQVKMMQMGKSTK